MDEQVGGAAKLSDGLRGAAEGDAGTVAEIPAVAQRGIEPRRLIEICLGPIIVALGAIREAADVIGISVARIEPDSLVGVGDRAVEVLLVVKIGGGAVVVGIS